MESIEQRLEDLINALGLSTGIQEYYIENAKVLDKFSLATVGNQDVKQAITKVFKPKSVHVRLIPMFDIHYGLIACNKEKLQAYIDLIEATEDLYTIIGGDTFENATKTSIGRGWLEENVHGGEQRRELTNRLRPISGKILAIIPGNHEARSAVAEDDDPLQEVAYDLSVPYCGYQAYLNLKVNDIVYKVFAHHGRSFALTKGGKANAAVRPASVANADVYLTGHTHERMVLEDQTADISESGEVVLNRRVYVVGGSLVSYFNAYPEMNLLSPSFTGSVMITLRGDTKYVSVTL